MTDKPGLGTSDTLRKESRRERNWVRFGVGVRFLRKVSRGAKQFLEKPKEPKEQSVGPTYTEIIVCLRDSLWVPETGSARWFLAT